MNYKNLNQDTCQDQSSLHISGLSKDKGTARNFEITMTCYPYHSHFSGQQILEFVVISLFLFTFSSRVINFLKHTCFLLLQRHIYHNIKHKNYIMIKRLKQITFSHEFRSVWKMIFFLSF